MNRNNLAASIITALLLTACGGGGGTKSDTPPPVAPPTNPPGGGGTNPPPPQTCDDPTATNKGGALPCTYRYNGEKDNLLVGTSTDLARAAGYTGAGVKVGLLDKEQHANYTTLDGKVASYKDYTPGAPSTATADHGDLMAAAILGKSVTGYNGGIAPDASLYWARVCDGANSCQYTRMGQAFTDLTAQGVRLFNLSLGSLLGEDQRAQQASNFAFYARPVLAVDGLIVAGTGNDGQTAAANPASTPAYITDFRNNMVAVGAVTLDSKGAPTGLESYSNHCGVAAEWCLVAPGMVQLPTVDGSGVGRVAGTSVATAQVTGVAALVWQAYPWMSASNLQQTLLTTATDLGAAGVDSMYGWGMVNAGKAVKGPGQFVGAFSANVTGESTFSNDISGAGSLVKRGTGTLVLGGNNTYTGGTEVEGGTLGVKGNVAGNVNVRNGATVAAQGGRVGGDYQADAGATTSIQIGKPFEIGGQARIDGSTLNLLAEGQGYAVQTSETLLRAGSVVGTFGKVTYGNGFFWDLKLDYAATSVTGTMTRSASAQSYSAATASVAVQDGARQADVLIDALDRRFVIGDTAGMEGLYSAAAALINASDADVATSLTTLTGQVHGTQRALAVRGALNDSRIAADRLPLLSRTDKETTWIQLDGVDGTMKRSGYADADYRQSGITVGIDIPVGDAVAGVSVTKGRTTADVSILGGQLETDRFGVTGYGYLPFGNAYVAAVAGIDSSDVETARVVAYGSGHETITNKRDESALHARVEAGMKLDNGLAPFVAVGAVHHVQDAFSEASVSGLGLTAPKDSLDAIFADAGVRFDKSLGAWEIGGLLAYRNVFAGDDASFNAWFTSLPDASFTVNGQPVARDSVRALIGAGYKLGAKGMVYGNVGFESHTGQGDNATANVGFRWAF